MATVLAPLQLASMPAQESGFPNPADSPMATQESRPAINPAVETLSAMFPDIEAETLEALLAFHQGDLERTCISLLDPDAVDTVAQEDLDLAVARQAQEEIDRAAITEAQRAVAAELTAEEQAEEARRKERALSNRTMVAVSKLVDRVKSAGRRRDGTQRVGLLDGSGTSDEPVLSPLQPAYEADYSPPVVLPAAPQATEPTSTAPLTAHDSSPDQYNARLSRARTANRSRFGSTSPRLQGDEAAPQAVVLDLPQEETPTGPAVGQLI